MGYFHPAVATPALRSRGLRLAGSISSSTAA
jgi:hypothetical protein